MALVLKTRESKGSVSSNLTASAKTVCPKVIDGKDKLIYNIRIE